MHARGDGGDGRLLEAGLAYPGRAASTLILANAAHIKGVPGRKSDVNDATWIADLLAHGLIRASFVPPQPIQELRDLTRTRKQLTREIVQHTQRIQAVLEEANVKLSSAITDILGQVRAAHSEGDRWRAKRTRTSWSTLGSPRLCRFAIGAFGSRCMAAIRDHHRFLIGQHLKTIEQLEATIVGLRRADRGRACALSRLPSTDLKEIPGLERDLGPDPVSPRSAPT